MALRCGRSSSSSAGSRSRAGGSRPRLAAATRCLTCGPAGQPARSRRQHGRGSAAAAADDAPSAGSSAEPAAQRPQPVLSAGSFKRSFVSEEEWREMDKKVNRYPSQRTFTAIGTGGDDFKAAMLQAVAAVVGTVHVECVLERPSSGGKYLSVRIGPVWVENADQVVAVFSNMRQDPRVKWFM